ncbi:Putative TrmH family tRNA/rRNA methyltransferase [Aedoeadaptatus ivorii]|uniref:TrmH family tRNA/rRNA methyltransferase n=1 Tax=Aedoeadaptatus ivorii TaxID=54006 RepID=A0A448V1N3_9FIRM|nr:RNA methyltransferase [Peptoniphilus ivorii]VEJ35739.1 Putative TrmH family tRNA/rRNA methyltransferase [Peptoniphilus ivorii]
MNRIDSPSNDKLKTLRKLKDKKYRERYKKLLLEGIVPVTEVLETGYIEEIFIDEDRAEALLDEFSEERAAITLLSPRAFSSLVSTESDQGVVAVTKHFLRDAEALPKRGRFLYADGVSDPGNLGGMIRSAEAFFFDGVLIGPNCVDPANDKSLRASMASAFRIPIAKIDDAALFRLAKECPIYTLDIRGDMLTPYFEAKDDFILAVGNEAHGIREEISRAAEHRIRIPIRDSIDSLNANVAASVAMFALQGGRS